MRKVIRPRERMIKLSIGSSQLYESIARGILAPFFAILGSKAKGCFDDDDDEVMEARAGGANDDQVRELVRRQVARRKARLAELKVA